MYVGLSDDDELMDVEVESSADAMAAVAAGIGRELRDGCRSQDLEAIGARERELLLFKV